MDGSEDDCMKKLSNKIEEGLKERLDRAVAGSDVNQRTALSAIIDAGLTQTSEGLIVLDDENLDLDKWSDHYG